MNKKDIIFWVAISLLIILVFYLFYYIRSESYECMKSPLVYGVSKFKSSQGEFTCSCSSPNSQQSLLVTKDNITLVDARNLKIDNFIK